MTGGTCFGSGNFSLGYVRSRGMRIAMTGRTVNGILAVLAQLPVGDNVGSNFLVAIDTSFGQNPIG